MDNRECHNYYTDVSKAGIQFHFSFEVSSNILKLSSTVLISY